MPSSSLGHILNVGSESLQNARVGVDVTGHNIANVDTPGFSRQQVILETKSPFVNGQHVFGDGARVQSIKRVHDVHVENQIRREIPVTASAETVTEGLKKLESLFNPDQTSTILDRFTSFTNSLRELANYPEERTVRMNVLETGATLAAAFNSACDDVRQVQADTNEDLNKTLDDLNSKLSQIADLNSKIRTMNAGNPSEANDLEDARDKLIRDVGSLIEIKVYKDNNDQMTIRGPGDSLLIEGSFYSRLKMDATSGSDASIPILISEFDKPVWHPLTTPLFGGRVGGLLQVRDQYAAGIRKNLNELAAGFAETFNGLHREGYGINAFAKASGLDFFNGVDGEDPASHIRVDFSIRDNPDAIAAAMSPETVGDNVIANRFIKMFSDPIFGNGTLTILGKYDDIIGRLGLDTRHAEESAKASKAVQSALEAQRNSISGVSLDEEVTRMLAFQRAYEAGSRIVRTADEMLQTTLDLKR